MRKEYNNRWTAPLINSGFTMEEYEKRKATKEQWIMKRAMRLYSEAEQGPIAFIEAYEQATKDFENVSRTLKQDLELQEALKEQS